MSSSTINDESASQNYADRRTIHQTTNDSKYITQVLTELQDDIVNNSSSRTGKDFRSNKDTSAVAEGKLYVQHNENFTEITNDEIRMQRKHFGQRTHEDITNTGFESMVNVAISVHHTNHMISYLCYGLLGGISLMQLACLHKIHEESGDDLKLCFSHSNIAVASILILTIICFIDTCDRIDLMRLRRGLFQTNEVSYTHWILFIIYGGALISMAVCFTYDDIAFQSFQELDISIRRGLNMWRSVFGIIGWILVCLTTPKDLFSTHLQSLKGMSVANNVPDIAQ